MRYQGASEIVVVTQILGCYGHVPTPHGTLGHTKGSNSHCTMRLRLATRCTLDNPIHFVGQFGCFDRVEGSWTDHGVSAR